MQTNPAPRVRGAAAIFTAFAIMALTLACILLVPAVVVSAQSSEPLSEKVLHPFSGGNSGENPWGGLVFDGAGNLYGTTFLGGSTSYCPGSGCGLVYKLARTNSGGWRYSAVHVFAGLPDGAGPLAGLVSDGDGTFYGTTESGGNSAVCQSGPHFGCGTAFQLAAQPGGGWKFTVLHTFTGGTDGSHPEGTLIRDAAGNLYGTASAGGTSQCGTVFKLSRGSKATWKLTTLHSFACAGDGETPIAGLLLDPGGNLYGTTQLGGNLGQGAVFELSPAGSGWNYQVLFSFSGADGAQPASGLNFDAAGNLYGATVAGGSTSPVGVIYQLSPSQGGGWKQSVIYDAGASGTATPGSALTFDARGDLYSTVAVGGSAGNGAILCLSPASSGWSSSLVYSFSGSLPQGLYPEAGVIFDHSGNLFGTAFGSGTQGGVVFEISPPQ